MIALRDQAVNGINNDKNLLLLQPTLDSNLNPLDEKSSVTTSQSTEHTSETVSTTELRFLFQKLALVGQMGGVIVAILLALEIVSGLTLAMIILGLAWIGCEHFVPDDCD